MLPYARQWIDEDDIQAVIEQLRSDWLTQGPTVERFEKELADTVGAKYAVAVSSGTAALHLACLTADLKEGDLGITTPITFVASANCLRYCGADVELSDIDPGSGLIDPSKLESTISQLANRGRTPKVIVAVDYAGHPADLPAIRRIADSTGAIVIEDASHSLGASYQHGEVLHRCGDCAHADMAVFSFHAVKHITSGEGGAITTNDEAVYQKLQRLRTHGITRDDQLMSRNDGPWYYEQVELGFNCRITDFQCALASSQLKRLSSFVDRRRAIAHSYDQAISRGALSEHLARLRSNDAANHAYHIYVVQLKRKNGETNIELNLRRRELYESLREDGVASQVHYIPIHFHPDFQRAFGWREGDFSESENFYSSCLSLPLFPKMTDKEVLRVTDSLERFFANERISS